MMMKLLLVLMAAQSVSAIEVERGTSENLAGVTHVSHPEFVGFVLKDKAIPFEIKNSLGTVIISGVYRSRVVVSGVTGQLVFSGLILDTSNPENEVGWVTRVQLHGFGFVDVDAEAANPEVSLGTVKATRVTRNAVGDSLTYSIGNGLLNPPDESTFFFAGTQATEYSEDGSVTIFASNDFGGPAFSVVLEGALVPAKPQPCLAMGERFFFETLNYYPIDVRGVAKGLSLRVETSGTLEPSSWGPTNDGPRTVTSESTRLFGEVNESFGGKQFFRVVCSLPSGN